MSNLSVVVCPSTGRPGGTGAWILGWWKFSGAGYRIPFARIPPLSQEPIPMPSLFQGSGRTGSFAFSRLLQPSLCGVEDLGVLASSHRPLSSISFWLPLPSRWRPSSLFFSRFARGDWMVSIDLKEAYLQIPVHPESRKYLRSGRVYQFRALCFGLASAPQVFTRVMAPVSSILPSMGIRLRRYLDDWLIQSSSQEAVLRDLWVVLDLCLELGIVVNPEKSNFVPSQKVLYLGTVLDS